MFDWIPLLQLGTTGALFAWFIYQYFQEQKVRTTLKEANTDRKTDTDEVARELNTKQEVCIAEMRKDIEFIKNQVSNHLPTSMKEIQDKLDKHIENQNIFEKEMLMKVAKL